jgi:hypothetical protein
MEKPGSVAGLYRAALAAACLRRFGQGRDQSRQNSRKGAGERAVYFAVCCIDL